MRKFTKNILLITVITVSIALNTYSQNSKRSYIGYHQNVGDIIIEVTDGEYTITPHSKKAFQISFNPKNSILKNYSFAVDKKLENVYFKIYDKTDVLKIESHSLKVIINKDPFNISFYKNAKLLFTENEGYSKTGSLQLIDFKIDDTEVLYGGGARVLGMNRRGNNLEMYNRAHYGYETHSELMNFTLPIFISSKQYMVLFDNASVGTLDLDSKKNNTVEYRTVSGTINYYVVIGNNWFDLADQYTALTGRQPLPPRWAFGNFSSRFGYHSQNEVLNTVNKFIEDDIPVDAVIIDIYWFGKGMFDTMGNMDWYRDSFPDPKKMINQLTQKGVKTILVTEPFVLTTSDRWQNAVDEKVLATDSTGEPYTYDFYFGNTGLIDVFKPEAKEWFWDIYKGLANQGISGIWGDLGEPEVHPTGLQHVNGSADEVHNAYGHEWAKMIFNGYKKDFPTQRPFILMRAGFAGSQQYGMIPWSGDVARSWGGLTSQPEIALQMGMQGLAYMHSDLGGFADGETIDNELYIRWLQYGVFQPIYRPHAQEHIPSEPVFQNETTKANVKKSIELRYKLLPYIYSMAFENNQTGKPLMYPLFYIEPENSDLLTYDAAYMWGDALLVSPIKAAGIEKQKIYLPKGNGWTDYYTNKQYNGGQDIKVDVTIDNIPVFAKGGEFIPSHTEATQTKNYSIESFEMHFYADKKVPRSDYTLYNDDGLTNNSFKKGMFELIHFNAKNSEKILFIDVTRKTGKRKNKLVENQITFIIHNIIKKPKKVIVNGEKHPEKIIYDEISKTAKFTTNLRNYTKKIEFYY